MMMHDIDIAILSVCLSVCHVPVLYQNGLTYHHTFFSMVTQSFYTVFQKKHVTTSLAITWN